MAIDFRIKRGLYSELFSRPGVVHDYITIESGCWYLCSDTAELFVGIQHGDSEVSLKRVNGENTEALIAAIEAELAKLKKTQLYQEINSEYELPTEFDSPEFSPNIVYYIVHRDEYGLSTGTCSTYVFDIGAQAYMCTNTINESAVRAMVLEAIELNLSDKFESMLPDVVKAEIKRTFASGVILHGGTA